MIELDQFIEENIDLIDDLTPENIELLYKLAAQRSQLASRTHLLTEALLAIGIDPLDMMTYIPKQYQSYTNMKELIVPDHITEIRSYAFAYCEFLEKVDIPESVEMIEMDAFRECYRLGDVFIRGENTKINYAAFSLCEHPLHIFCPERNEQVRAVAKTQDYIVHIIDKVTV